MQKNYVRERGEILLACRSLISKYVDVANANARKQAAAVAVLKALHLDTTISAVVRGDRVKHAPPLEAPWWTAGSQHYQYKLDRPQRHEYQIKGQLFLEPRSLKVPSGFHCHSLHESSATIWSSSSILPLRLLVRLFLLRLLTPAKHTRVHNQVHLNVSWGGHSLIFLPSFLFLLRVPTHTLDRQDHHTWCAGVHVILFVFSLSGTTTGSDQEEVTDGQEGDHRENVEGISREAAHGWRSLGGDFQFDELQ